MLLFQFFISLDYDKFKESVVSVGVLVGACNLTRVWTWIGLCSPVGESYFLFNNVLIILNL